MQVRDFLEANASRTPGKLALVCGEQRLGYAELDARADRVAHALRDRGVQRGDRVVLWGHNGPELVAGIFGVAKASAVFVVANDTSKAAQVDYLVRDCRAKVLVTTARHAADAAAMLDAPGPLVAALIAGRAGAGPVDQRLGDFDAIAARGAAGRPPRDGIDRDLACLVYTSGSTGQPKGVMCAHHQVAFASASILAYLGMGAEDVVLCALPLSFDYGLYQLLMTCRSGGTLVLERSFAYPAECLERIAAERVTGLPGVPTLWALLLGLDLSHFDLSSVRFLTNTAAALPPHHAQRLQQIFPRARIFAMYGLTETKRTLYLPPEHLASRPGSVGFPIPGTEVWIENDAGERLGANQVGELVVRGGHVMSGYWEAPEATAQRFRPGPLPGEHVCRTGDLFQRDEQGFHFFVGRRDDILKCRGEKVAPREVENVLHELTSVREAVVLGEPDPVLGQAIVAVVVRADPGLDAAAVLRHCKQRLEDFKVPSRVEFVAELPKTSTGKVKRNAIVLPPRRT
ncbi:MAG: acyl--CoA ligase [Planctomycetes bacterium]|nr:acyl--CoA ligase [Planctomycetota bacterium]